MTNLILLLGCATATLALWPLLSRVGTVGWRAFAVRVLFIAAYGWTLLLALRFCGRTYPGIWMRDSALLNAIFNGVDLFYFGYFLALAIVAVDLVLAALRAVDRDRLAPVLVGSRSVGLALTLVLIAYGFFWAIMLGRLPGG